MKTFAEKNVAINELLDVLNAAVRRVEIANTEGNPILSAWLPDARAALEKAEAMGFSSVQEMGEHQNWLEERHTDHSAEMAYQQSPEAQARIAVASRDFGIPRDSIIHVRPLKKSVGPGF